MIIAKNYIKTGFSIEDAEKLTNQIEPNLLNDTKIEIDFTDITIFTTLFFNNALAKYILKLGPDEYEKKFSVLFSSELGEITYQHSIDNAKDYYNKSDENKEMHDNICSDIDN